MARKLAFLLLAASLAMALAQPRASAAVALSPATVTYTMPGGADPQDYFFNFDGDIARIPGSVLLPPSLDGSGGANLHAGIDFPGTFSQLKVTFDYAGGVRFLSQGNFGFTPWTVSPPGPVNPPGPIFLTAQTGSAHIGDFTELGRYFGFMELTGIPDGSASALRDSTFIVQAFVNPQTTVPEPGTTALLGSLLVTAGLPLLRRMRRRA